MIPTASCSWASRPARGASRTCSPIGRCARGRARSSRAARSRARSTPPTASGSASSSSTPPEPRPSPTSRRPAARGAPRRAGATRSTAALAKVGMMPFHPWIDDDLLDRARRTAPSSRRSRWWSARPRTRWSCSATRCPVLPDDVAVMFLAGKASNLGITDETRVRAAFDACDGDLVEAVADLDLHVPNELLARAHDARGQRGVPLPVQLGGAGAAGLSRARSAVHLRHPRREHVAGVRGGRRYPCAPPTRCRCACARMDELRRRRRSPRRCHRRVARARARRPRRRRRDGRRCRRARVCRSGWETRGRELARGQGRDRHRRQSGHRQGVCAGARRRRRHRLRHRAVHHRGRPSAPRHRRCHRPRDRRARRNRRSRSRSTIATTTRSRRSSRACSTNTVASTCWSTTRSSSPTS